MRAHRVWILEVASQRRYTQAQDRNLMGVDQRALAEDEGQLGQTLAANDIYLFF